MRKCPSPNCNRYVDKDMVACRAHWAMLPAPMRNEIWRTYRSAPGTPAHLEAIAVALRYLRAREEAK